MASPAAATSSSPRFKDRVRVWLKPPRRLALTRAGIFFCALTLGVGLGALNTGNNLLFLLEGMMLSLIVASGVLSEASIRRLRLERIAPKRLIAKHGAPGAFSVRSIKRYPSLGLTVREDRVEALEGPARGRVLEMPRQRSWQFYKVTPTLEAHALVAAAHVGQLAAGERREIRARWVLPVRGRWALRGLVVSTRFPFGLFEKSWHLDKPGELWVYPAPAPVDDWRGAIARSLGEVPASRAGAGEDFFELRAWREGDDPRRIHWKATARRGEVVLRQDEDQQQRAVEIVVLAHTGHSRTPQASERARFEMGLRKLSGLLDELSARGWRVGLRTPQAHIDVRAPSARHTEAMLRAIAVLELGPGQAAPELEETEAVARIHVGLEAALATASGAAVSLAFDAIAEAQ